MATFGLLDCNNFYASCETVFNPKLEGKPLVILSNNDGCAVSRSNAAKALGVKMGAPWFQIQQQFKQGEVLALSSNYALYADMSNRVVTIVAEFTPDYEVYSIDECFLNLDGFPSKRLTDYAMQLKSSVLQRTGLPVCIGIASTKTLAKLANHCAKKRPEFGGVCNFNELPSNGLDSIFASLPVSEIWGVGSRLEAQLNRIGITTVLDLKQTHTPTLRSLFSVTMAKTIAELNGDACIDLENNPAQKQNIASTRSVGIPVSDLGSLSESVTLYASRAAEKARAQKTYANSITVFIQTSPFANRPYYDNSQTIALPSPSNDTRILVKTALWLLKRIYRPGHIYQKAGVILNDLVPKAGVQRDLFFDDSDVKLDKRARVTLALDEVNQRFGKQTLRLASQGFKSPWRMKQNFKSPGYTTDWNGLVQVN